MIRRGKKQQPKEDNHSRKYGEEEQRKTKNSTNKRYRLLDLIANQASKKTGKEKQLVYHDIKQGRSHMDKKIPQIAVHIAASQNSKVLNKKYLFIFNLLNQI